MPQENIKLSGQFKANITKIEGLSPLNVKDFVTFPPSTTPGNVGVCLSGGGSRAMTAGMGQLRGLKALNLLEQTKAISTVSGGSWVGVTFAYLNASDCSDDDYLGTYLTPSLITPGDLDNLPETAIGYRCTKHFGLVDLLIGAFILHLKGVPANMLWQTLIGNRIMAYYQLFDMDKSHQPNSLFSFDAQMLERDITGLNPSLADEKSYLIASGANRIRRPFLICNMGMCVNMEGTDFKYLVPVQATPFFTGVLSTPPKALDFNGKPVGGGTVTSFAFGSDLISVAPDETVAAGAVTFTQSRQFALADAVGVSSAAFAETLENLAAEFIKDPLDFIKALLDKGPDINRKLKPQVQKIPGVSVMSEMPDAFDLLLNKLRQFHDSEHLGEKNGMGMLLGIAEIGLKKEIKDRLSVLTSLVPKYKYWPVFDIEPNPNVIPTHFTDAGSLENTGINGMLMYADIDNIIAFINTSTPLGAAEQGVIDPKTGKEIPDTRVMVDSQLPPLFGYQPYKKHVGYKIYDQTVTDPKEMTNPEFRYNQVFPSEMFVDLLKGLWENCGKQGNCGSNFVQSLVTLDNEWFGVKGGKKIRVLWVYNGNFNEWYKSLPEGTQEKVSEIHHFPFYSTAKTELSYTEVNALASLTSWNVAEGHKQLFLDMFKPL